ncbi:MAG: murein biosynthesis integral membrane protein MurJ [bacterium]
MNNEEPVDESPTSQGNHEDGGMEFSAIVVSIGTLSSRILGLVRDIAIATVFGASRVTDVFFMAYKIPSIFRKLLGEGALSSSLVPVYTDLRKEDEQKAKKLGNAAFTWGIILITCLTILGIVFAGPLVTITAPGFWNTPYFDQTVTLTRVMFPFLICMGAASVVMGILHARKRYAPSAFAPAMLNVFLILSILYLAPNLGATPEQQIWALAVGVLVGGFFQFFVQWLSLKQGGQRLSLELDWRTKGLKRVVRMMAPMTFGLSISQLIVYVDSLIATLLREGNVSHLYYSNRLFQFPFALVGIAVGTVVLPESSDHVTSENIDEVTDTARYSIGMMSFLMIPSMVGLWMIGYPLIGLLFRSQEFSAADQTVTFWVLFFALFGLVAYGFIRIFVSLQYSFEDTMGPVKAAFVSLVINSCLDVLFVYYWPSYRYAVCGLTLAGSFAVWGQAYVLRLRLRRHLPDVALVPWKSLGKHCVLTAMMAICLWGYLQVVTTSAFRALGGSAFGAIIYMLMAYVSGEPYPERFWNQLKERLS